MDILSNTWNSYEAFAQNLSAEVFSFLIRANLALLIPSAIMYAGFVRGWRNSPTLTLLIVIGTVIGLSIPIDNYVHLYACRPWIIPVLLLGLIYLPAAVAFFIEPRLVAQIRLRKRIQIGICALFILNLFTSCSG